MVAFTAQCCHIKNSISMLMTFCAEAVLLIGLTKFADEFLTQRQEEEKNMLFSSLVEYVVVFNMQGFQLKIQNRISTMINLHLGPDLCPNRD